MRGASLFLPTRGGARLRKSDRGHCRRPDHPAEELFIRVIGGIAWRSWLAISGAVRRHHYGRAPGTVDPCRTGRGAPRLNTRGRQRVSQARAARAIRRSLRTRWRHGGVRAVVVAFLLLAVAAGVWPDGCGARVDSTGMGCARHRSGRAHRRHGHGRRFWLLASPSPIVMLFDTELRFQVPDYAPPVSKPVRVVRRAAQTNGQRAGGADPQPSVSGPCCSSVMRLIRDSCG
mgnify:CR=1 FL=1